MSYTSAVSDEVQRFGRIADEWWDPRGMFAPLHRLNPVRLAYVRDRLLDRFGDGGSAQTPLAGRSLLDIGCGGGLVCEPMARLGAAVTGVDASEETIAVAAAHARQAGVSVAYRVATVERLRAEGLRFDAVLALEIVEHVADPAAFLADAAALVAPGGLLVVSTLNRTLKALALAKIGAEYVLRWLPEGTHDWAKFLRPSEVWEMLEGAGLAPFALSGLVFRPLRGMWELDGRDVSINYVISAAKSPT